MIRALSVIALLLLYIQVRGQSGWMKFYPGDSSQFYTTILPQQNGDFILGGTYGFSRSILYTRIDGSGTELWSVKVPAPGTNAAFMSAEMLGDSLLFAAGWNFSTTQPHLQAQGFIQCMDTDGNLRWTRSLTSPPSSALHQISTTESGQIYACGVYWSVPLNRMLGFVTAVDLNGDEIWRKEFQLPASIGAVSQVAMPNGDLMVHYYNDDEARLAQLNSAGDQIAEFIFSAQSYNAPFAEFLRLPNGHLVGLGRDQLIREWSFDQGFIRRAAAAYNPRGLTVTAAGEVVSFGNDVSDDGDLYLKKLRTDFSVRWSKGYESGGIATFNQVRETFDGGLILVGWYRPENAFDFSGMVARLDCNGDLYEHHLCASEIHDFVLFPNPNSGNAYLGIPDDMVYQEFEIDVWDPLGRLVQRTATKNAFEVNLKMESLNQGTYFLHVKHDGKIIWRSRWVVQR